MKVSAKNAARPWGFTLIELLTVIAIIGVLATLISASLVNAQRKGRKAVSTSNLRQIALAFNLYVDDHQERPSAFSQLVATKFLTERILICPEDRIVKNWAGLIEPSDFGRIPAPLAQPPGASRPGQIEIAPEVAHSYFKSFDYRDDIWQSIDKNTMAGIAACQLHGIGRQSRDQAPSINDYQGLVLRALKDGSVVSRQVFWAGDSEFDSAGPSTSESTNSFGASSQLPLFLDPAQ
ncbi:MAG: type II secretion system protein [Limisphaerales bacterium]